MKFLNSNEVALVAGAMASMSFGPDGVIFTTTGDSTNFQGGKINGISYSMIMYSDHVTDLKGNLIFEGTSGQFCHLGSSFNVSPVAGGSKVAYAGFC